jgi:hypothetical protein
MREYTITPGKSRSITLPRLCPACLQLPDTTMPVQGQDHLGWNVVSELSGAGYTTTLSSVEVPVCQRCKDTFRHRTQVSALVWGIPALVLVLSGGVLVTMHVPGYQLAVGIGIAWAIGSGAIMLLKASKGYYRPARISAGELCFYNKRFQRLFEEANPQSEAGDENEEWICSECGATTNPGSKICSACGATLE